MVTRLYVKKTRMNYFGFGKKVRKRRKRRDLGRGTKLAFCVHLRLLKIVDSEQASNYFYDMNNAKSK